MIYCPECEARLDADDLVWPIPDVCERILPGEPMPMGACPNCGELIFKPSDEEEDNFEAVSLPPSLGGHETYTLEDYDDEGSD